MIQKIVIDIYSIGEVSGSQIMNYIAGKSLEFSALSSMYTQVKLYIFIYDIKCFTTTLKETTDTMLGL